MAKISKHDKLYTLCEARNSQGMLFKLTRIERKGMVFFATLVYIGDNPPESFEAFTEDLDIAEKIYQRHIKNFHAE